MGVIRADLVSPLRRARILAIPVGAPRLQRKRPHPSSNDFKRNPVTRFKDIPEGLAQISIRRFLRVVKEADYDLLSFEAVPIKKLRLISNLLTREFTTSFVRCKLKPRTKKEGRRETQRMVNEKAAA